MLLAGEIPGLVQGLWDFAPWEHSACAKPRASPLSLLQTEDWLNVAAGVTGPLGFALL